MIDALREIVLASHAGLNETLKWNAPSYAVGGEDRITLGVERKGGVRLVLHRGAKSKDVSTFSFQDSAQLAKWPAPDRGIVTFANQAAIEASKPALSDLCRRWIEQTA